jgi:hypothetical protein
MSRGQITAQTWSQLGVSALVWLVPALLLLPFYLLLVLVSVLIENGELLELVGRLRGGIHCALGPLLVAIAIAGGIGLPQYAVEGSDWVFGVVAVLITGGLGVFFVHRELSRIAAGR